MPTGQTETRKVDFRFGPVQLPRRYSWPAHGRFVISMEGETVETRDMFSVAAARDILAQAVLKSDLTGDQAADFERQMSEAGLPVDMTRCDLVSKAYGGTDRYEYLIEHICGLVPSDKDSCPASLRRCTDGRYCHLRRCAELPPHAVLRPKDMDIRVGNIMFSRFGAETVAQRAVESGLLLETEAQGLKRFIAELSVSQAAEQADRFIAATEPSAWADHLEIVFGFLRPRKSARFEPCKQGRHHLYIYDESEFGLGATHQFDTQRLLERALDAGFIATADYDRLCFEVQQSNLPPGSEAESDYADLASAVALLLEMTARSLRTPHS